MDPKKVSVMKSTLVKFKPWQFRKFEYNMFDSLTRYFGMLGHVAIVLAVDLSNLFGKSVV